MNCIDIGAKQRPTLSLRFGAGQPQAAGNAPASGIIPVLELRRLVAAMVD